MRKIVLLAAGLLLCPASASLAQSFPDRPVRALIPYPAGGSIDAVARPVSHCFQENTGQPLVLENRGGANGMIAAAAVAKAAPDGTTLLFTTAGPITVAPAMVQGMTYDPRTELMPISALVDVPMTLFIANHLPMRTLPALLEAAKAQPGRLSFGLPGTGSIGHLATALFAQETGTQWMEVGYRGASIVLNDMAGGTVDLTFTTIASARPMVDAGRIHPIAVASARRSTAMPDLPSFAELGLPRVEASLWMGVMAPARTPAAIIDRLNEVLLRCMSHPAVANAVATMGGDALNLGPQGFAELLAADYPRWSRVVRQGNITMN